MVGLTLARPCHTSGLLTCPLPRTSVASRRQRAASFVPSRAGTCFSALSLRRSSSPSPSTRTAFQACRGNGSIYARQTRNPLRLRLSTSAHFGMSWRSKLSPSKALKVLPLSSKLAALAARSCPSSGWVSTSSSIWAMPFGLCQRSWGMAPCFALCLICFASLVSIAFTADWGSKKSCCFSAAPKDNTG